jgi:hypothetical protein
VNALSVVETLWEVGTLHHAKNIKERSNIPSLPCDVFIVPFSWPQFTFSLAVGCFPLDISTVIHFSNEKYQLNVFNIIIQKLLLRFLTL